MKVKRIILILFILASMVINFVSCNRRANDEPAATGDGQSETVGSLPTGDESSTSSSATAPTDDTPTEGSTEGETTPPHSSEPNSVMPDQSYVGVYVDKYYEDKLFIYEITPDSVHFSMNIFRTVGFEAAAIGKEGQLVFGDGISPDYRGPSGITGRLEFDTDGVTLIFEDFGTAYEYIHGWGTTYRFVIKADEYDDQIEDYKSDHPKGSHAYDFGHGKEE